MSTTDYQYKITYHPTLMACMFVRIKDDAILYCNDDESNVKLFANGFCTAKNTRYYIE